MISSITPLELDKVDGKIIDIRSVEKYNDNHIPGSIHIPMNKLILNPKEYLNFTDTFYFYCQMGSQSIQVCMFLRKLGYKAINIKGGYEAWILSR